MINIQIPFLEGGRQIDDYLSNKKLDSKEVTVISPRRAGKTWFCLLTAIQCVQDLGQTVTIIEPFHGAKTQLLKLMSEVNSQKTNDNINVISVFDDDGDDAAPFHGTKVKELQAISSDVVIVDEYFFITPSILQILKGKSLTLKVGSPNPNKF